MTAPARDSILRALRAHRLGHAEGEDGERLLLTSALAYNPGSGEGELELLTEAIVSALPSVSSLLGELAVVRGALEGVKRSTCLCCAGVDVGGGHSPLCMRITSALATGSGRLAGEVIRAAVRLRAYLAQTDVEPFAADPARELIDTVDALLAAHPEIRGEVGGG